jgi:hypothetical protein
MGFARVLLAAGQICNITITLNARSLCRSAEKADA